MKRYLLNKKTMKFSQFIPNILQEQVGEWDLNNPNIDNEGLKANALLKWLDEQGDVEIKTFEDEQEINRIEDEIEKLKNEYENSEKPDSDLLDEISDLEDELQELESKVTVYNLKVTGSHYDLTEFETIDIPNLEGRRYAVGDEDEMQNSAVDYVEQLIDDIGYKGFSKSFLENHIDYDKVADYAQDYYEEDVYNNPEVYFDDAKRELSSRQIESIDILKEKISRSEELIERLESYIEDIENEEIQSQIEDIQERISDYETEIEDIEGDPQGDYPSDIFDDKISELVDDVRANPKYFMEDFGLDIEEFIDKDEFVRDVIDSDGYGMVNGYDGNVDEIYVKDQLFYVMRID